MRQVLLAACVTLPLASLADPQARFDAASDVVHLTGLEALQRADILLEPDALRLQVVGSDSTHGMPFTLAEQGTDIVITPRFALRAGTDYVLSLDLKGTSYELGIALPPIEASAPELTGFSPSQAVIPANTLRLYVHFSEPMARGQLRDAVVLMASDGTPILSPFLNLEAELWDPSQTRATLLLDPGRIKQGVGPNTQVGAPLLPEESYRLVVSGWMQSAAGVALGADKTLRFRVSPPERRAIMPENWQIQPPTAGSRSPLTISFDRIMDSGAVQRFLHVQNSAGHALRGRIRTDGGGWSFVPEQPWQAGNYHLIVDPELEDVSGNTTGAPFDATFGTMGADQAPITLTIEII